MGCEPLKATDSIGHVHFGQAIGNNRFDLGGQTRQALTTFIYICIYACLVLFVFYFFSFFCIPLFWKHAKETKA
jgi:Na+-driven multidrug efflux pump